MAKNDYRKGALPFEFIPVPKLVLTSGEWCQLPHSARVLALDLAAQYTGKNNGRLTPTFDVMHRAGWASRETLARAKKALLEASFVVLTRKGHAPRTAEWLAFTWWKLDFEPTMEVDPKAFPHLSFQPLQAARIDPNKGRQQANAKHFVTHENRTDTPPKTALRLTKVVPMTPPQQTPSVRKS